MNDDVAGTFSVEDDNIPSLSPVSGSVKEDVGVRPPSLFLQNEFCECAAARRRDQAEAFPRRSTVGEIWDEGDSFGAGEADDWHDSNLTSDVEGSSTFELLPEPRKVQKVFVKYDRPPSRRMSIA